MKLRTWLGLALVVALAAPTTASAATWDHTLAMYGWGTWITGDSNFGPKSSEVKVSAGDVMTPIKAIPGEKPGQVLLELPALIPGEYAMKLKIFAADGHLSEDLLRFFVKESN